ncbi:MAG: iron-sulfur cluster assembly scaffold protein [Dehalococcoidia bacterium]|nr:iron-sulfur cluster assembly scaffold protein [Dehalococcoidia bacterium]
MPQYTEKVIDHFMHPRNVGEIENPDGVSTITNPACGDTMMLQVKITGNVISEAKWRTLGCSVAIATSSIASEMMTGMKLEEAEKLSNKAIADALGGLPRVKMHCSVLAADALKDALKDFYTKHPDKKPYTVAK